MGTIAMIMIMGKNKWQWFDIDDDEHDDDDEYDDDGQDGVLNQCEDKAGPHWLGDQLECVEISF